MRSARVFRGTIFLKLRNKMRLNYEDLYHVKEVGNSPLYRMKFLRDIQ